MKPQGTDSNRTRSRSLLGPLAAALALATLPACSLDRSPISCGGGPAYECTVVVRDADWRLRTLDLTDRDLVGETRHVFATPDGMRPDGTSAEDYMLSQCKRYAARVLTETLDSGDTLTAGRGPHHLVAAAVRRTDTWLCPSPEETGSELEPDSGPPVVPEACENGPGDVPVLTVSSDVLSFGNVGFGGLSGPLSLVVANTGTGRLCLLWPHPGPESANPEDFAIDARDCAPAAADMASGYSVLDASRPSCTISARFTPQDPGSRSSSLWVSGIAEPPLATVRLEGTGQPGRLVVAEGGSVCIPRDPRTDRFQRTLHFDNTSSAAVRITSVALPAEASGWFLDDRIPSNPPLVVAPGGSFSVRVNATSAGESELIVENNGLGGRLSVGLRAAETCP